LGCTRPKGVGIYPTITLIGPAVLCWRKGEKQILQWLGQYECASYLDRDDPISVLLGRDVPGHTPTPCVFIYVWYGYLFVVIMLISLI